VNYHKKSKREGASGQPLGCTIHTDGPGGWMKVPETAQQPKEQLPPTPEHPVRLHHRMALPYTKG